VGVKKNKKDKAGKHGWAGIGVKNAKNIADEGGGLETGSVKKTGYGRKRSIKNDSRL